MHVFWVFYGQIVSTLLAVVPELKNKGIYSDKQLSAKALVRAFNVPSQRRRPVYRDVEASFEVSDVLSAEEITRWPEIYTLLPAAYFSALREGYAEGGVNITTFCASPIHVVSSQKLQVYIS
ncbi:hypothetical protein AVEN_173075-1 [Araneus ventricosus]|uniref:Uncharacterized protein n=1 Tax=Araneus ventricosus TaxID=182803 RepID=A0A4Y2HE52_ARAVE|nr:hypothetical protein AVEN_173075-1 [Araneus ventricosus]